MDSKTNFLKVLGTILGGVLIFFASYFVSWAMTSGLIWIIFKIFRLDFSLRIATGIWLVLVLLQLFIRGSKGK